MRTEQEQRNLQHVLDMFNNVLVPLNSIEVDRYISPNYIQQPDGSARRRQSQEFS